MIPSSARRSPILAVRNSQCSPVMERQLRGSLVSHKPHPRHGGGCGSDRERIVVHGRMSGIRDRLTLGVACLGFVCGRLPVVSRSLWGRWSPDRGYWLAVDLLVGQYSDRRRRGLAHSRECSTCWRIERVRLRIFSTKDSPDVKTLQELEGKTIGVVNEYDYGAAFDHNPKLTKDVSPDPEIMVKKLNARSTSASRRSH